MSIRSVSSKRKGIKDYGTSLLFNGSSTIVTITNNTTVQLKDNLTLSAWIKRTDAAHRAMASKWVSDNEAEFHWRVDSTNPAGRLLFFQGFSGGGKGYYSDADGNTVVVPLNQMCLVSTTKDSEYVKHYINGSLVSTEAVVANEVSTTAADLVIGQRNGGFAQFKGFIDEFRLYNRTLTAEEILSIYHAGEPDDTGLKVFLKFDEGSGTTALDSSGSGNNGVITDGTYSDLVPTKTRTSIANRFKLNGYSKSVYLVAGGGSVAAFPSGVVPSITGFNLSFWFKEMRGPNGGRLFSWEDSGSSQGFYIQKNSTVLQLNMYDTSLQASISTDVIEPFIWQHMTITFKPNELKLFLNATQVGSTDTNCSMAAAVTQMMFGRRSYSPISFGKFKISDIVFENTTTPWTQTQIEDIYYRTKKPTTANEWTLDNTANDVDGNNELTLNNAAYDSDRPKHFGSRTVI